MVIYLITCALIECKVKRSLKLYISLQMCVVREKCNKEMEITPSALTRIVSVSYVGVLCGYITETLILVCRLRDMLR